MVELAKLPPSTSQETRNRINKVVYLWGPDEFVRAGRSAALFRPVQQRSRASQRSVSQINDWLMKKIRLILCDYPRHMMTG